MVAIVKKYNYLIIALSFTFSLSLDYLQQGKQSGVYVLPVLIAAITLPLIPSLALAVLIGLFSLVLLPQAPNTSLFVMVFFRIVFFLLTDVLAYLLVKRQTSNKDDLIRELTANLDINKTLHNLILNDSKTALEVIDRDERIVNWNTKAGEMTGCDAAVGKCHTELFPYPMETGQNKILETLHSGKEYLDQEITLYFQGKEQLTALVNTYALKDDSGAIVGALALYRDITERKILERQIQQAEKFAALGQMAAGLAHEIRNPLTTVKGFLQLMSPANPIYSEYQSLMLDEVERTNKLISDFILLANPSAPRFKAASPHLLIHAVLDSLQDRAGKQQISLEYHVPHLPPVLLDEEQFKHLLGCLTDNAIEAMPKGGVLGISARLDLDTLQVQVWDTGQGIPSNIIDKIFDPFFTTKETGSGLGLAISYHIVKNHRGSIKVRSHPNSGSTFTIAIPVSIHPGEH